MMLAKKRKYDKQLCPHCSKEVSKSTWYEHYDKFYNTTTNQWQKSTSTCSRFDFSSVNNQDSDELTACYSQFDFTSVHTSNQESEGNELEINETGSHESEMESPLLVRLWL